MKVWLLSLLVASYAGVLSAQPVDLLQQLYGKKALPFTPVKEIEDDTVKPVVTESITITLRDRFEASRERLFLSDVAVCKGSRNLCDELVGIDIGIAPKPMRYERLARQYGQLPSRVELQLLRRITRPPDNHGLRGQGLALRIAHRQVQHVGNRALAERKNPRYATQGCYYQATHYKKRF
ncbi:MAG: hypothetical protein EOO63_12915 [Hymenobacter sp.]|nr:MAG: hypothetical protein EOO63_12915 [Hymenobacter sp.]